MMMMMMMKKQKRQGRISRERSEMIEKRQR